jgi:hypothetical protein
MAKWQSRTLLFGKMTVIWEIIYSVLENEGLLERGLIRPGALFLMNFPHVGLLLE